MKTVRIHNWRGPGAALIKRRLRTLAEAHGYRLRFTHRRSDESPAAMALDCIAGGLRVLVHLQRKGSLPR